MGFTITPGNDLLSHTVAHIVPSALRGLSALFGMGRGISPAVLSPEYLKSRCGDEQSSCSQHYDPKNVQSFDASDETVAPKKIFGSE